MKSTMIRLVVLPMAALLLSGCPAALQGYPETKPDDVSTAESAYYLSAQSVKDYDKSPSEELRNNIIDARMRVRDRNFREFKKSLYQEGLKLGLGVDWLLLTLAGATATVGGETLKAALGAVTTGIVGAKASFDKRAFMEKSLAGIFAQMKAQRAVVELSIRTKMSSGIDVYSVHLALSDLEKYYDAGTLPDALDGIIQGANVKSEEAEDKLAKFRVIKFQIPGSTGARIKEWYRPAGVLNPARRDLLVRWLATARPGINPAGLPFPVFLRERQLEPARVQAITDLRIP